jgi:hypothetical protein
MALTRLSIIILIFSTVVFAAQGAFAQTDEVLVRVPSADFARAHRIAPAHFRSYQRLSDFILVGTSRKIAAALNRSGIAGAIVDEQAWSGSYAVAAPHPGYSGEKPYVRAGCRVLVAGMDYDLIKGTREQFELLRSSGYSCVEILQQEIPVDDYSLRLPRGVYDRPNDAISEIIANVSDTTIRSYIQSLQNFGTRYWSNANRDTVARWLRGKYLEAGVTDAVLDSFQYSGTWQKNVVATIPGTAYPTAELIVGGHHDSYSSNLLQAPGADDNATGATAAIEMARVLKLVNYQPRFTMRFMGYGAEEAGLVGSASYASRARTANRDIRVMQNYDMIGNRYQAPTDNSVYIVWYTTSEAYRDLHATMMQTYTNLVPVPTTSYRSGSDSYSFWQQNYRTVFCIEKNFSPYYHSPSDLLQYVDPAFAAATVKSGLAMLLTLDMMPPALPNVQVLDQGDGSTLVARWDSVAVRDWYRYKVYVGTAPGVYTSNTLVTKSPARVSGLTAGTTYYVGVSIVDLAGQEGMITELSCVPMVTPRAPLGIDGSVVGQSVHLGWRPNAELDLRGYYVYRSVDSMRTFARLQTDAMTDTAIVDSSVAAWPRAYFITAVDSTGHESSPSDTLQFSPPVAVGEQGFDLPIAFGLQQNYPNPFNPATNIRFSVAQSARVTLVVCDVLGRVVERIVDEEKNAGTYDVVWDAGRYASGVYYAVLKSGGRAETRRMILMK